MGLVGQGQFCEQEEAVSYLLPVLPEANGRAEQRGTGKAPVTDYSSPWASLQF